MGVKVGIHVVNLPASTKSTALQMAEKQLLILGGEEEQLLAAGLLDPLPKQLFKFYGDLAHLNFGESRRIQNGVPVVLGRAVGPGLPQPGHRDIQELIGIADEENNRYDKIDGF